MFNQILTALDGSEFGERALMYTTGLAQIAGARVTLLYVLPALSTAAEQPDDRTQQRWRAYLDEQAEVLRAAGVAEVRTVVQPGDPAREITEVAREHHADLIVMSTQGLGAEGRYALGSVALNVLMTAPCPVFMVRINKPEPPRTPAEERWQAEGGANTG